MSKKHLLIGCSFTDPMWQSAIPWSVEYAKTHPSYIVAKAAMGIKGICTEAMYYIKDIEISKIIIILPTLWRIDIEVDEETYLCNSMVDLLYADQNWQIITLRAECIIKKTKNTPILLIFCTSIRDF
jgi:hypothetical protein